MSDRELKGGEIFLSFFYLLRAQGIPVSVREWLTWLECMDKGLVAADLRRAYSMGRATLIKHERHLDLYDQCFGHYFGGAPAPIGLHSALEEWLSSPLPLPELDPEAFAQLEALDLDALKALFEERLKEQKERHDGGSKWVGTGGTSPFGHNGRHPTGVRVGGSSQNRSAIQIVGDRRFIEYRSDRILDTRQMTSALRRLRRLGKGEREDEVDIDETIYATARQGGELEVILRPPRENQLKLILLMDVGGSMDGFAQLVERLFSAAHQASHFKAFHALYFHNCVYDEVYKDARFREPISLESLSRLHDRETRLLILGDACMSPYELFSVGGMINYGTHNLKTGAQQLASLREMFKAHVWLNPLTQRYWRHPTIEAIGELFPMFELTLDGLDRAVRLLSRGS
jgi:uncharacterized protein